MLSSYTSNSALMFHSSLSRHDKVESAKWLVNRGLLPTRTDQAGRDALMHACDAGGECRETNRCKGCDQNSL